MGGIDFTVHRDGVELAAAFEAARQDAAREYGWCEDSGTITTKEEVTVVHPGTLSHPEAEALAKELLERLDEPYCDHYGIVAAAIPTAEVTGGPRTGWLFFGVACD